MEVGNPLQKDEIWVDLLHQDSQNTWANEPSRLSSRPVMLPVISASSDMQHNTVREHAMAWTI
jgi:hypothetical protein